MNQGITKSNLEKQFITESGFRFDNAEIAYKTWGTLNDSRDNVILICHALTGHAAADEWFPGLIGEGRIADPAKNFILCINVPGSCYGSIGPWTINPETGRPYKSSFPTITIRDMVKFQQMLLDQLDIKGIELIIGGSLGGMQALEFIITDNRIRSAALIAMGKSHTPWAIGISHAQRTAIFSDLKWNNGDYEKDDAPFQGIAAARMMAMITYRTPEDYNRKFGRKLQNEDGQFQVESYLNYQGEKLAKRFDALSYVSLTKSMDTHDVTRGRGSAEEVLKKIAIPVEVIGINSDHLYPVYEQKELARLLGNAAYSEITSDYGHDAFLIEFEQLNKIIEPFLKKQRNRSKYYDTVKSL
ncbi:MAG: homoserine O-acetyltransferase [Balneolaceae bacterium]|nr:homoserine O-acetyltransferase [Balneolaceae bacterium]